MISETHLSGEIKTEDIQLKRFQNPIRKDRNRHGGDVAIYAKNSLHIRERPEFHNTDLEIIWVEVSTTSSKIMIGVMYRPPNSLVSYWQTLENNLQSIIDMNIPIFLGGDLNVDMLTNHSGHLGNLLSRLNLENIVLEPTRITDTSATCLDLFITNRPNLILSVNVLPNFCSDHCPVSVDIIFFKNQVKMLQTYVA